MNLANEVSSLLTEVQSLRSENEALLHNKAIIEFENEGLRRALAKSQSERDNFMRRAEAIKSLLDQTGANLVNGINKYHESERELQARQIAGNDEPPMFLSNGSGKHADRSDDTVMEH